MHFRSSHEYSNFRFRSLYFSIQIQEAKISLADLGPDLKISSRFLVKSLEMRLKTLVGITPPNLVIGVLLRRLI